MMPHQHNSSPTPPEALEGVAPKVMPSAPPAESMGSLEGDPRNLSKQQIAQRRNSQVVPLGAIFGRLTFMGDYFPTDKRPRRAKAVCACGKVIDILFGNLVSGNTKSCGCYHQDTAGDQCRKHGHRGKHVSTKTYKAWCGMYTRCYNQKRKGYEHYGGRGIEMCPEWRGPNGFQTFLQDMGEAPSEKHSLDRRDNSLGYSKANCRWATCTEQSRNRRNVHLVTLNQETLPITLWSIKCGLKEATLRHRLRRERKKNPNITPTQIVESAYQNRTNETTTHLR